MIKMRCYGCMEEYSEEYDVCPYCGYVKESNAEEALQMVPGTLLANRYLIGRAVGCGGFGVTYIAWDTQLERKVAVKEYLPSEFATRVPGHTKVTVFSGDKTEQFGDGLDKFIDEAKRLAKFRNEKGIVKIYDSFKENNTAYIIMEYLDGETLASYLAREGKIPADKAINMLLPVMKSLAVIHERGIIHRDIAPDNIVITKTGDIKLIDFGAARYATTSHSRSLSVIVKPGYSPEEQYRSRGDQVPRTDVYALGGVLYKMITGVVPPDALERRAYFEGKSKDILEPVSKYTKNISKNQEKAILNAMNVRIEDRTPDVVSFMNELTSEEPVKRRSGKIGKIDPLTWPTWLKVTLPTAFVTVCTLLVLLLTGVINFGNIIDTEISLPEGMVRVPSITNYVFEDAKKITDRKKLNLVIGGSVYNNDVDIDKILLQEPDVATKVNIGTQLVVTVSAGAESEFVPNVTGFTAELARQELEKLGFTVEVKEKESDMAPGSVIEQSPKADEKLALGKPVTITVSTGKKDIDTSVAATVPDILGKLFSEAQKELMNFHKLYIAIEDYVYSENIPAGQIVSQSPDGGAKVKQGDTVKVVISKGKKMSHVPSVVGMSEDEAKAAIENSNLIYSVQYEENKNVLAGHVISQSPARDTEVATGTRVIIKVSLGYMVKVPKLVGQNKKDAESALAAAGLRLGGISYQQSSTVPKNVVISQSISAGQKVNQNTAVNLVISSGNSANEEEKPKPPTITGITVVQKPSKTEYYIGDSFSTSGMKVTANYSDGSSKDVTSSCTTSGFDSSTSGSKTVRVTYKGEETMKASFIVYVNTPKVTLNTNSVALKSGTTERLTATTAPYGQSVSWSSSNTSVATVSGGTITGVKEGSTTVTAKITYNSRTYSTSCTVTVTPDKIEAKSVILDKTDEIIYEGRSVTLTATVLPNNTTDKTIIWSSSNPSVATVRNGVVTGVSEGTAKITATCGNKTSSACTVTVKGVELTGITITQKPYKTTYYIGEKLDLTGMRVMATYSDGSTKAITPKSESNTDSFTQAGSYTVKYSYQDGGITQSTSFDVTVVSPTISLNTTNTEIKAGSTFNLSASTNPSGQSVSWKSSNTSVATVSGGKVTGVSGGTATITASFTYCGYTYSAKCTVNVKSSEVAVTGVSLNATSASKKVGDTFSLTATVSPSNATNKTITWSSNNTSVATVSSSGAVTCKATGTATITAKSHNGKTASCTVTVTSGDIAVTGISLNTTSASKKVGDTFSLTATVSPSNATNKTVTWSSNNTSVATVSSNGSVTCKAAGTATITAKSNNGKSATCKVTVTPKGDYSGTCGNNAFWEIDSYGTLTISGTGAMTDYRMNTEPWWEHREQIKKVVVQKGITDIGAYAFSNCYNVLSVELYEGLQRIWTDAFFGCVNLKKVDIPKSVTYIGTYAFVCCKSLESINVPADNSNYTSKDGVLFNKNCTTLIRYPAGKKGTSYTIPNGVTKVESYSFYWNDSLQHVYMDDTVKEVGHYAFGECYSLKGVEFSKNVTVIRKYLFDNCQSLESVIIPRGITTIEEGAFNDCTSFAEMYYLGSRSEWDKITIDPVNNDGLASFKLICQN